MKRVHLMFLPLLDQLLDDLDDVTVFQVLLSARCSLDFHNGSLDGSQSGDSILLMVLHRMNQISLDCIFQSVHIYFFYKLVDRTGFQPALCLRCYMKCASLLRCHSFSVLPQSYRAIFQITELTPRQPLFNRALCIFELPARIFSLHLQCVVFNFHFLDNVFLVIVSLVVPVLTHMVTITEETLVCTEMYISTILLALLLTHRVCRFQCRLKMVVGYLRFNIESYQREADIVG